MKTIETARLLLRPYAKEDFDSLYSILSDEITMQYWTNPFTAEKIKARIERSLLSYKSGFGKFAVIHKESGALIGDSGITIVEIEGSVENNLGYIIHHTFHGRGYGTEAAAACVRYAFDDLRLRRLTANIAALNLPSIRVAEKLGMKKEKEFFKNSHRGLLTYMYSLIR